ncbi:MAG TPA: hypothetical protein VHA56_13945 [Mucilaginibacter sp.]|nr:hypothetical protein [Mucilaginibacter sp.]
MKKSPTPNASLIDIDIENKISTAYLFSVAAKSNGFNLKRLFIDSNMSVFGDPTQTTQSINNKSIKK